MDLEDLKKQLYKKDGQFEDRPKPPEEFEAGHLSSPLATEQPAPQWSNGQPQRFYLSVKQKRQIIIGGAALGVVLLILSGWLIWRSWFSFDTGGVALDIFGQDRIVSGEEINYVVRFKNNSNTTLNNLALDFIFPGQSRLSDEENAVKQGDNYKVARSLGSLASGQERQAEFKVRVLGDKDSQQKFLAKLTYRPANINADFSNNAEFTSTVISVPLVLSFVLPERIVSGQAMNITLKYLNTSDATFSDAKIKLEYPAGFTFDSASPTPSDGNSTWGFSEIGSREEGTVVIRGTISGNEGETKVFKAQIGTQKSEEDFMVYAQSLSSPQISLSPLFIEQTLLSVQDNTVNLGQSLTYKIKYRNTTDVAIGPVVITVKIDSRAVDLGSVSAAKGFFSSSEGLITWNASSLEELESLDAKTEGTLEFMLRVKDRLPVSKFSDKNFAIITAAKISSPNTPLSLTGTDLTGQHQLTAKINSRLALSTKGYFIDQTLPNIGPLPPQVGQKTTYTIYWQLLNISNDISNVKVEAYLPSYVRWEDKTFPQDENIKYDEATGKITWQISKLSAGVGLLSPVKQVAFQVGLVPSVGQVGDVVVLVKESKVTADDNFTGQTVSASDSELKSDLPDDASVGLEKGKVFQ